MNEMKMEELIRFGRSWAYAPEISIIGNGYISKGYTRTERCYQIENSNSKTGKVEITLKGSKDSPVLNPAIKIKNWNTNEAKILLNGREINNTKVGINYKLEGDEMIIYIPLNEMKPVKITVVP
jgi:hypothetical protein